MKNGTLYFNHFYFFIYSFAYKNKFKLNYYNKLLRQSGGELKFDTEHALVPTISISKDTPSGTVTAAEASSTIVSNVDFRLFDSDLDYAIRFNENNEIKTKLDPNSLISYEEIINVYKSIVDLQEKII
jgi:hypothetical protein